MAIPGSFIAHILTSLGECQKVSVGTTHAARRIFAHRPIVRRWPCGVVDNAGDVVVELAGEGTDTVQSSIFYVLDGTLENLTLAGGAAIDGTGNDGDNLIAGNGVANSLTGGSGNDTLNGGGADTLVGGVGNDLYVDDNPGDVVIELADEGTDTVQASASHTLSAHFENLVLTGGAAIYGTGNGLDNAITGNGAANRLDGGGGADTLIGGTGDDTYVVDDAGDVVTEAAGQGTDTVETGLSAYTLGANLENLAFTGSGDFAGTGNGLDNAITGGVGNDTLDGGAGADTLVGGVGDDVLADGSGDDVYVVDDAGDIVVEAAGEGVDLVRTDLSALTLAANVENLTYTGTDSFAGTGNDLANVITGDIGSDTLDGGISADTLVGGSGDDVYVVDDAGDVVVEDAGEGVDLVRTGLSTLTLAANVQNLAYTGTAGFAGTGNGLANVIVGGIGNDTLDSAVGVDTLTGGTGGDRFIVDGGDVVTDFSAIDGDLVDLSG